MLDNIILGVEPTVTALGFLQKAQAREKVMELSERTLRPAGRPRRAGRGHHRRHAAAHGDPQDALPRQRGADLSTSRLPCLTPQEIEELMEIMRGLDQRRASPSCSSPTSSTRSWPWRTAAPCCARASTSARWTWQDHERRKSFPRDDGRPRCGSWRWTRTPAQAGRKRMLDGAEADRHGCFKAPRHNHAVKQRLVQRAPRARSSASPASTATARAELVYGADRPAEARESGHESRSVRSGHHAYVRSASAPRRGLSHIPEDRHKHGLVLDYSLEDNLVLQALLSSRSS